MKIVAPLYEGPVDIVGDVHGELAALWDLLAHLGYERSGRHPKGRKLVFVGDLCDRGPDSPEVLRRVLDWVAGGHAQAVLGNHELNLLREDRKAGNGWFFARNHDHAKARFLNCQPLPEHERGDILRAVGALPLVLERSDLRVVHACSHEPSLQALHRLPSQASWARTYDVFETLIEHALAGDHRAQDIELAWRRIEPLLDDPSAFFEHGEFIPRDRDLLEVLSDSYEQYQMGNPLRVLTSGIERAIAKPYYASHRWRLTERMRWWNEPQQHRTVVGHYWRSRFAAPKIEGKPDLVDSNALWLGPDQRVLCIDFSVGARNGSGQGERDETRGYLAAWRSDTGAVVFDR